MNYSSIPMGMQVGEAGRKGKAVGLAALLLLSSLLVALPNLSTAAAQEFTFEVSSTVLGRPT